jgi:type III secretion system YscQ/HrcQ family protein
MDSADIAVSRAPRLRRLGPEPAEPIRHVLGRAPLSRFTVAGTRCTWRWQPLPSADVDGQSLRLSLGPRACVLTIHDESAPLTDPAIDLAAFEGAARAVAAALRYAVLIEHLERLLGGQLAVQSVDRATGPAQRRLPGQAFAFHAAPDADARMRCTGVLDLGSDSSMRWTSVAGTPAPHDVLRQVPIAISVLLDAGVSLRPAELHRLHAGAVVLLARSRAEAAACWLHPRGASLAWRAQRDGFRVRVLGRTRPHALPATPFNWRSSAMEDKRVPEPDAAAPPAAPDADLPQQLDSVPVHLEFVIGEVRVPHGQLAATLATGSLIDLGARLDGEAVSIRANGMTIARGELLEIGDVLGVRITRLQGDGPV